MSGSVKNPPFFRAYDVRRPTLRAMRRTLATLLVASGITVGTLAATTDTAAGVVPTPPPPRVVMNEVVTDNYKTWDRAESDNRTSMIMTSVTVGTTTYVVNDPGTSNGAAIPYAEGLPLKVAGGSGTSAYLRLSGITQYRVFSGGGFGPYHVVNKATLPTTPVTFTATVRRASDDALLGRTTVEYRYDEALALIGTESVEHHGPGGRWYVHDGNLMGGVTPLNWPNAIAFRATTVPAGVPSHVVASPVDMAGIPVPNFHDWPAVGPSQPMPLTLSWNPNTGQPTQTTGDDAYRAVPITLSTGSYTVNATANCDGFCAQDYADSAITGSATITADPAAPTVATVRALSASVAEGDSGGWHETTVVLQRIGRTGTAVTVDVAAVSGDDVTVHATTVTFAPGETHKELPVFVLGDTTDEDDDVFDLDLSGGGGATLVDGTVTVLDDDEGTVATHDTDSQLRRLPDGAWKGAGIVDRSLNDVGTDQTVGFGLARGRTGKVAVKVTNTGTVAESFWIASGITGAGAKVTFWAAGVNVTAQVNAGSYATAALAPGASTTVTVKFVVPSTASLGAVRRAFVHAIPSGGGNAYKDVVLAKVTVR